MSFEFTQNSNICFYHSYEMKLFCKFHKNINLSSGKKNTVRWIFLHLKTVHSSTAETGSRSYHVYRDTSWKHHYTSAS